MLSSRYGWYLAFGLALLHVPLVFHTHLVRFLWRYDVRVYLGVSRPPPLVRRVAA